MGLGQAFAGHCRHPLYYSHGIGHTEHNALLNQLLDGLHSLGPVSCSSAKVVTPSVFHLWLVLLSGVRALNHPSNGLKGNLSGSLRFICVVRLARASKKAGCLQNHEGFLLRCYTLYGLQCCAGT